MSQNNQMTILTTRLNSVWVSMQEIIPGIEKVWEGAAENLGLQTTCILAEESKMSKALLSDIMNSKYIIVTAFNLSIVQKLVFLRDNLGIDTPWVFYLHNQATIGLWPLYAWKLGDLMNDRDQFISTSERDAECFNQLYENKKAKIIPFYYPREKTTKAKSSSSQSFVYVGRISEQKNLHTLLWSYSNYLADGGERDLHLYGKEDFLGSPNMAKKSSDYQAFLNALVQKLGLEKKVFFNGFVQREELYETLDHQKHIFISLSLHSDENFGMAALCSLMQGNKAILTSWGGHRDFCKNFSEQVKEVKVYESWAGPYVDPYEVSNMMRDIDRDDNFFPVNDYYSFREVQKSCEEILQENASKARPSDLQKTDILEQVISRITPYDSRQTAQIFDDYTDKLAHVFLRAYGMTEKKPELSAGSKSKEEFSLAPWVDLTSEIHEPHRGIRGRYTFEDLVEMGLAF